MHPELTALRTSIDRAWDAWDAGMWMPAQTLAAAAVSSIVNEHHGFARFSGFRKQWDPSDYATPRSGS